MALAIPSSLGGDGEAFEATVRRFAGAVLASARRQLGDAQMIDDAVRNVFLGLQTAGASVERGRVPAWLFAGTRNVSIHLVRAREEWLAQQRTPLGPPPPPVPRSSEPLFWLDDAIAGLRADERRVIVERFFVERSTKEVAEAVGAPVDVVEKRLARAIDRVRALSPRHLSADEMAATLTAALPGAPMDEAGIDAILRWVGRATPAMASSAETMATTGPRVARPIGPIVVLAGAGVGLIALLGVGAIVWNATLPPPAPPPPPRVAIAPVTPAIPPSERPENLANAGRFADAFRVSIAELKKLDPQLERDRKDFDWMVAASRADTKLDDFAQQRRAMYRRGTSVNPQEGYRPAERDALRAATNTLLADAMRDAALVDWRAYRLLARLDDLDGDQAARRRSLEAAIAAYPAIEYRDPPTLSSLHDLYDEAARIIAKQSTDSAAMEYLLGAFARDRRYAYVATTNWESSPAYPAFAERLARAYEAKARSDPAHRERYLEYAAETRSRAGRK